MYFHISGTGGAQVVPPKFVSNYGNLHTIHLSLSGFEGLFSLLEGAQVRQGLSNCQEEFNVIVRQTKVQLLDLNLERDQKEENGFSRHGEVFLLRHGC